MHKTDFYTRQSKKLMKGHGKITAVIHPILSTRYGTEFATETISASNSEFENLIPEIPYIGGKANQLHGYAYRNDKLIGPVSHIEKTRDASSRHRRYFP